MEPVPEEARGVGDDEGELDCLTHMIGALLLQKEPENPENADSKETIWSGELEWEDAQILDQPKTLHTVQCKICSMVKEGQPEINTENWPNKLKTQLIPKKVLGKIGEQFLKDARMVVFRSSQGEVLNLLITAMSSGFAGCIHFPSNPNCNIKALILIYSRDHQALVGFIPNNEDSFSERLQEILQGAKRKPGVKTPKQPQPEEPPPVEEDAIINELLWTGTLNWSTQASLEEPSISHKLECSVYIAIKNGDPGISAEDWPTDMPMVLMPSIYLGQFAGAFIKDSKLIILRSTPGEEHDSLASSMSAGSCGCARFSSEVVCKVIMLLYSSPRNAFLGFIPRDQANFVKRLREVLDEHRQKARNKE